MVHVPPDALPQAARALYPDGLALHTGNVDDVATRLYGAGVRWHDMYDLLARHALATSYEYELARALFEEMEVARKLRLDLARVTYLSACEAAWARLDREFRAVIDDGAACDALVDENQKRMAEHYDRLCADIDAANAEYERSRLRCVLLVLALRDLRRYERARDW